MSKVLLIGGHHCNKSHAPSQFEVNVQEIRPCKFVPHNNSNDNNYNDNNYNDNNYNDNNNYNNNYNSNKNYSNDDNNNDNNSNISTV